MSTSEAVDYFSILQDKYGSPNLIESEVVDMLNHAQFEYLNRLFPDNQGGVANVEVDSNVVANVQPLIYTITTNMAAVTGLLSTSTINTALVTASGDSAATYFRVLSVGVTADNITYPVKYIKQNNLWSNERNYFKKASLTNPRYTFRGDGLKFYPVDSTVDLTITVVKNPKTLSLSPAVNPEFKDYAVYQIIMIALQLAGVSTRDEEIIRDIQGISLQAK